MELNVDLKEQELNNFIREYLVIGIIYAILCSIAYFIIRSLRKLNERDDSILDYEDAIADRVSIILCVLTLATCIGAGFLLPISVIANEIIINYSNNYYLKWLNSSLIYGLWNKIFLLSNLSLFLFIPFAYFFSEAIGLPGYKKGIKSRIIETCSLIIAITLGILGISYVIASIVDSANAKANSLLNLSDYHLPFLYSCISFIGVLFLLICTPLGFARLFTVITHIIMKRTFSTDLREQLHILNLEEASIQRRVEDLQSRNAKDPAINEYFIKLNQISSDKKQINQKIKRSSLCKNFFLPLIMILLFLLTSSSIFFMARNTFYVIFGRLPTKSSTESSKFNVGIKSLYTWGFVQTTYEIMLIFYFMVASIVGLYSLPILNKIRPNYHLTEMRRIILNCVVYLIFSSALPISSKILGLTNFDLLGRFGELRWLGNANIILIYNVGFATATAFCLVNKFSATVRSELYNRVLMLFQVSNIESSLTNINRSYSTSTFD